MPTKVSLLRPLLAICFIAPFGTANTLAQANIPPTSDSQAKTVDALVHRFDRSDAPGVSVAVYRAGKIIYSSAAGMADLEHDVPLTTRSVFDIASMSKQFTAMAVVLLQGDGRLSLDDEIQKFIPEVHTAGKKVTIRQLLQHASGIRDYLDLMELAGKDPDNSVVSQADVLDIISAQTRLNFDPGDAFRYENTSYALMATLVQRVSGKSLREFAAARIFGPLGMTSTVFRDNHTDLIKNRACGYEPRDSGWSSVTPIYDEVGDGGVWTTVEDLAKWDANFYQPRVGGEQAIKLLQSQAILNNGRKMSYALGLFVEKYRGFLMVSHGGVDPGYRAQMLRFPSERLTVAVLANNPAFDVEGLARQIADIYLPKSGNVEHMPLATPVPTNRSWPQLAGKYLDEGTGRTREIVSRDNTLVLRSLGREYPLEYIGGQRFRDPSDDTLLIFETKKTGSVRMTMSLDGQMPSVSRKLPATLPAWNAAEYVGAYTSSEIGVTWHIQSQGPDLVLRRRSEKIALSTLDSDEFAGDLGLIHFIRSASGRVAAFTVTNVRDIGIEFRRSSLVHCPETSTVLRSSTDGFSSNGLPWK
jgi:CubicO group peptidase (beta-lactamase class C family)